VVLTDVAGLSFNTCPHSCVRTSSRPRRPPSTQQFSTFNLLSQLNCSAACLLIVDYI